MRKKRPLVDFFSDKPMKSLSPAIVLLAAAVLVASGQGTAFLIGLIAGLIAFCAWLPAYIIDVFFSDKPDKSQ
jgi:hypothetical protein